MRQRTQPSPANCDHHIPTTPVLKVKVVAHYTEVLKAKVERQRIEERNNLKIRAEGEAVTSEEFQHLLEEETAQRKKGKNKGKKSSGKSYLTSMY